MSFEVFVHRLGEGQGKYKRSILFEILGEHARIDASGELSSAYFSDDDWAELYVENDEDITGLAFQGGGEKIMQAMWELADRTHSVIFWPAESNNYVVTKEATLTELDPDFLKKIQPVQIVKNGREIDEAIANS